MPAYPFTLSSCSLLEAAAKMDGCTSSVLLHFPLPSGEKVAVKGRRKGQRRNHRQSESRAVRNALYEFYSDFKS